MTVLLLLSVLREGIEPAAEEGFARGLMAGGIGKGVLGALQRKESAAAAVVSNSVWCDWDRIASDTEGGSGGGRHVAADRAAARRG